METNSEKSVDLREIKMNLLKKVSSLGPVGDIDNWRKAFPEIYFWEEDYHEDEDDEQSETQINWEGRTIEERLVYVVFEKSDYMEVHYSIVIDKLKVNQIITDRGEIWQMWLDGCFSGEDLEADALKDFMEYTIGLGEKNKREEVIDMDLEQIEINDIDIKVTPF